MDGSGFTQRLSAIGFPVNGEDTYAYAESVDHAMEAFLIDWGVSNAGHRANIQQPNASPDQYFTEAGIGIVDTNGGPLGPEVITVDFGRPANTPTTSTPPPRRPASRRLQRPSLQCARGAPSASAPVVVAAQTLAPPTTIAGVVVPQAPSYNPAGWSSWGSTWTANSQ